MDVERGADDVGAVRAARQSGDKPARAHVPMRRAQAGKRRHHIDPRGVFDLARERLALCGGVYEPHLVAQPLDDRAAGKDAALEGVGGLAAESPRDSREQAVARGDGVFAGVREQEAAGAVGIFAEARVESGLSEQGALLVAHERGDGISPPSSVAAPKTPLVGRASGRTSRGKRRAPRAGHRPNRACGC